MQQRQQLLLLGHNLRFEQMRGAWWMRKRGPVHCRFGLWSWCILRNEYVLWRDCVHEKQHLCKRDGE
jgi:hypothetical protein